MTDTIQIHFNANYDWAECAAPKIREFTGAAAARKFVEQYGGIASGLVVTKTCGSTVKFAPKTAFHSVCPACGSVWQLQGDTARRDDEVIK